MWPFKSKEPVKTTDRDIGHYVRLSHKLATRLGIERGRARDARLDVDFLRSRNTELHKVIADLLTQNNALRQANAQLDRLLDDGYREPPSASLARTLEEADRAVKQLRGELDRELFPAGTIGW